MDAIDVLVLGGGPAGSTIALTLARAGRTVALVERSGYRESRIGETLAPTARPILARLGLWERFDRDGHAPSYAIRSAWGRPQLYEQDFVFHPYGTGWHLERRGFDKMIADAAQESGARLYLGARLEQDVIEECGGWIVSVSHEGAVHHVHASFVVDATGRAASFARRRGAVRQAHDALVGVVAFLVPASTRIDPEFYTLVEATQSGWWYSALLPHRRMVAMYMTDADLLPRDRQSLVGFWQDGLKQTDHTKARLGAFSVESGPRIVAAGSSTLDYITGRAWLAAGDAAMAFDPLSSQGISHALESGALVGEAVDRHLRRDPAALPQYTVQMRRVFNRYAQLYARYYGREQRWPDSTFWKRRHATSEQVDEKEN